MIVNVIKQEDDSEVSIFNSSMTIEKGDYIKVLNTVYEVRSIIKDFDQGTLIVYV